MTAQEAKERFEANLLHKARNLLFDARSRRHQNYRPWIRHGAGRHRR